MLLTYFINKIKNINLFPNYIILMFIYRINKTNKNYKKLKFEFK